MINDNFNIFKFFFKIVFIIFIDFINVVRNFWLMYVENGVLNCYVFKNVFIRLLSYFENNFLNYLINCYINVLILIGFIVSFIKLLILNFVMILYSI